LFVGVGAGAPPQHRIYRIDYFYVFLLTHYLTSYL
jgi:hypothetical protein